MSMETWLMCEKAPVTMHTQIEQYGIFVKHGGATSHFKASVSVIFSNKPSCER